MNPASATALYVFGSIKRWRDLLIVIVIDHVAHFVAFFSLSLPMSSDLLRVTLLPTLRSDVSVGTAMAVEFCMCFCVSLWNFRSAQSGGSVARTVSNSVFRCLVYLLGYKYTGSQMNPASGTASCVLSWYYKAGHCKLLSSVYSYPSLTPFSPLSMGNGAVATSSDLVTGVSHATEDTLFHHVLVYWLSPMAGYVLSALFFKRVCGDLASKSDAEIITTEATADKAAALELVEGVVRLVDKDELLQRQQEREGNRARVESEARRMHEELVAAAETNCGRPHRRRIGSNIQGHAPVELPHVALVAPQTPKEELTKKERAYMIFRTGDNEGKQDANAYVFSKPSLLPSDENKGDNRDMHSHKAVNEPCVAETNTFVDEESKGAHRRQSDEGDKGGQRDRDSGWITPTFRRRTKQHSRD